MNRRVGVAVGIAALIASALAVWMGRDDGDGASTGGAARTGSSAGDAARGTATGARAGEVAPPWFGIATASPRAIAGTVFVGTAPGAATLELRSVATDAGAMAPITAAAGPDGKFAIGPVRAGAYRLAARAPGSAPGAIAVDVVTADATGLEIFLAPCRAVLFGEVRDASGGPIIGATIEADGFVVATAGADGRYQLCLGPSPVLSARADGYAASTKVMTPGAVELDFELVPEVVVEVTVLDDADRPVPGALVTAQPPAPRGGTIVFAGTQDPAIATRPVFGITGADGTVALRGVPDVVLRVTATSGALVAALGETIDPDPGKTTTVTLHLVAAIDLRGVVVRSTGDKPRRPGAPDAPLADVVVHWTVGDVERGSARSGADGTFTITRTAPGSGRFTIDEPDVIEGGESFTAARDTPPARLVVDRGTTVGGRVMRAGAPVGGATVSWLEYGGATTSRSDGSYTLVRTGFMRGDVTIQAISDALGAFGDRRLQLELDGGSLEGIDVELEWGGAISGVVIDQHGRPLAGVRVSYESTALNDYGAGTTNTDGTFVAAQLRGGGSYAPTLTLEGAQLPPADGGDWPATEVPAKGKVGAVRLVARADRTGIAGIVVDTTGAPVPDVVVRLAQARRTGRTAADGTFSIATTHPGPFVVEARASGDRAGFVRDVAAGTAGVRIVLGNAGRIHARCGAGIHGLTLIASARGAWSARPVACDSTTTVPPGTYSISGGNFADAEAVVGSGETVEVTVEAPALCEVTATVVPPTGVALPADLMCELQWSQDSGSTTSVAMPAADGTVSYQFPEGPIEATCTGGGYAGAATAVAKAPRVELVVKLTRSSGSGTGAAPAAP